MTEERVERLLGDCGAFLEGHFLLTSGLHSGQYIEKALISVETDTVEELCGYFDDLFDESNATVVVSPATGAIVFGYVVARQNYRRFVYAERKDYQMVFARTGYNDIVNGERICL